MCCVSTLFVFQLKFRCQLFYLTISSFVSHWEKIQGISVCVFVRGNQTAFVKDLEVVSLELLH